MRGIVLKGDGLAMGGVGIMLGIGIEGRFGAEGWETPTA